MILTDVNVLVYAFREDTPDHEAVHRWLLDVVGAPAAFGLSELVLSGFLRVVTHPKIFAKPTPMADALGFVAALRSRPNAVILSPGARHWTLFEELCRVPGTKGNLVPDAYHAALAIESGSEWITTDRGFARFRGLKWRHPLD